MYDRDNFTFCVYNIKHLHFQNTGYIYIILHAVVLYYHNLRTGLTSYCDTQCQHHGLHGSSCNSTNRQRDRPPGPGISQSTAAQESQSADRKQPELLEKHIQVGRRLPLLLCQSTQCHTWLATAPAQTSLLYLHMKMFHSQA